MTDLAALRRLPEALLRAGYVDAIAVRGTATLDANVAADLEQLPAPIATLVRVLYLRGDAARADVEAALGPEEPDLVNALLRLGVLIETGGRLSSGELVAMPIAGRIALVPSPRAAPAGYFGPDVVALLARLAPSPGRTLVLGAGPGILAMRAAAGAGPVIAVEHDPVALGCAELNAAMNGLADRIELRQGTLYEPVAGERFERVAAAAPASPVPIRGVAAYTDLDGPAVARRIVEGLGAALADGGVAQIAAAWHGGDGGPAFGFDLAQLAAAERLRVVVALPARQPLSPGSALFETLVRRATQLGRRDEQSVRRAHTEHLRERGSTHLYLSLMTICRSARPEVTMTRHFVAPGGSWFRL